MSAGEKVGGDDLWMLTDLDFVECATCFGVGVDDEGHPCGSCAGHGTVAVWGRGDA
jgi:DnaJ-class molecular chaperone